MRSSVILDRKSKFAYNNFVVLFAAGKKGGE